MLKRYFILSILFVIAFASITNAQNTHPKVTKDTTLCLGSSLDLNELITDYGTVKPVDAVWYVLGAESGLGGATTVTPNETTRYVLRYRFFNGQTGNSDVITVKIINAPAIEIAATEATICAGGGLLLQLQSSVNVDTVWWERLDTGEIFADGTTAIPNKVSDEDYSITYRVYGKNSICGQTLNKNVNVNVKIPLNLSSIKVVGEYSFCIGETVDLTKLLYFSVTNNKGKQFFYYHTDSEVSGYFVDWSGSGITNPTAYRVTSDVTLNSFVTAQIVIPNYCGAAQKNFSNQPTPIKLKVQGTKPSLTSESVGGTQTHYPYIICQGDSVLLNISSGSCGDMEAVEWISPAISDANRVEATSSLWKYYWKPTTTTTFQARIKTKSKSSGAIETENVTITIDVKNYPKLVAIADTSVCSNLNNTIDLNGLLNTSAFVGSPDWGSTNPIVTNPNQSKTYHVKATSKYQCQNMPSYELGDSIRLHVNSLIPVTAMGDIAICKGSQVTLTAQSEGNVVWSKSYGGAAIPANQTPDVTTQYYANVRNACGLSVDSVLVTVKLPPVLNLSPATTVCKNESVDLYAISFVGDSVLWDINGKWVNSLAITVKPTETTTYIAKAYENGCETIATVTITVKSTPYLKAMDDLTICEGQTIVLTAESDAAITWNVTNTTVTPVSDTVFYVSATNGTCTAYDSVVIQLIAPPTVVAMADIWVCYGTTVTLTTISASGEITWNTPSTTFKATETAEYIVTASNGVCASASDTVVVAVGNLLHITPDRLPRYKRGVQYDVQIETNAQVPIYSIIEGNLPGGFYLTNSGSIGGISSGGGLLEKSIFTIEVLDENGCKVEKDYLLEGEVFISEVFTPNGDGYNDHFMEGCHVIIYNRLGVKLFEGNNGWDGTHNGKVMLPNTYFYIVTIVNEGGKTEKKSGSISIVKN